MAKWVTPERQAQLVKLFLESRGFCIYGLSPCQGHFEREVTTLCAHTLPATAHRKPFACSKPMPNGELCRFKPIDGKPHLPCQVYAEVKLFWRCGYGDYPCYSALPVLGDLGNLEFQPEGQYSEVVKALKREWSSETRSQDNAEWQAERKALHALGERREPVRGRFNTIARDIKLASQPLYYFEGLGMNGITFKPFAKVRVASTFMHLYVDLGDSLSPVSKNRRHKAVRYGKPLPKDIDSRIADICNLAVTDYLNR